MVSHEAGDTSPPIGPGRGRQTRPQKSYAVGLEMLCPGGAYAWAPKIPSAGTLAGSMPSKCELVHNLLILSRTARGFGPALTALIEDVIDPVQSEKAHDDQIDRHCEAHDPRRDQQKHSRGQGNNRQ
jgi:hypothetical protein